MILLTIDDTDLVTTWKLTVHTVSPLWTFAFLRVFTSKEKPRGGKWPGSVGDGGSQSLDSLCAHLIHELCDRKMCDFRLSKREAHAEAPGQPAAHTRRRNEVTYSQEISQADLGMAGDGHNQSRGCTEEKKKEQCTPAV